VIIAKVELVKTLRRLIREDNKIKKRKGPKLNQTSKFILKNTCCTFDAEAGPQVTQFCQYVADAEDDNIYITGREYMYGHSCQYYCC
jgi:hypothetical protein